MTTNEHIEMRAGQVGRLPVFDLTDEFAAATGKEAADKIIDGLRQCAPSTIHRNYYTG